MLKRIIWLALLALGGWLVWSLWRQRQGAAHTPMPQFAPIAPAAPSEPGISPATRASSAASAPAPAAAPTQPPAPAAVEANGTDPSEAADTSATAIPAGAATADTIVGYCTRCREKRPIKDAHIELTENGRRAARGTCPVCGGNMYTFLKKEA